MCDSFCQNVRLQREIKKMAKESLFCEALPFVESSKQCVFAYIHSKTDWISLSFSRFLPRRGLCVGRTLKSMSVRPCVREKRDSQAGLVRGGTSKLAAREQALKSRFRKRTREKLEIRKE